MNFKFELSPVSAVSLIIKAVQMSGHNSQLHKKFYIQTEEFFVSEFRKHKASFDYLLVLLRIEKNISNLKYITGNSTLLFR